MNKFAWAVMVSLAVAVFVGCDKKDEAQKPGAPKPGAAAVAPGNTAVVNLDEVAQKVGYAAQIQDRLQAAVKQANETLAARLGPMNAKLEELVKAHNDIVKRIQTTQPSNPAAVEQDPEVIKARNAVGQQQQQMQQLGVAKREEVARYEQKMKLDFVIQLRPYLKELSETAGIKVLIPTQFSAYAAPDADLTSKLVDMVTGKPLPPPAPVPADM